MSDEKLSIREIRDITETEGLGEAIQNYLSSTEISDDTLAKMWRKCADLLNQIQDYINDEDILAGDTSDIEYDENIDDDD